MRAFSVFLLVLLSGLLLAGCSAQVSADRAFSYAEQDFSAMVTGRVTRFVEDGYTGDASLVGERLTDVPQAFSATVTAQVETDAVGERRFRHLAVTYTDPPALRGMTVTYTLDGAGQARVMLTRALADKGVGTAERSITVDLSATHPAMRDALLAPVGVLLPVGDITAVSAVVDGRYTVTRADGDTEAVFTFAKGQTLPVEVMWTTPERQVEIEVKQS